MSQILIERSHTLGLEAARQHARHWAAQATAKFGVQCRYEAGSTQDVLHFDGSGMQGQLQVSAEQLRLEAELGFLAARFQEKIEAKLHAQLDAMLAS